MRRRKEKPTPATPERLFELKLQEERSRIPGMTIKVERMPQGKMRDHVAEYLPAGRVFNLYNDIYNWLGDGTYLLRFVDEKHRPLDEFGSMWIRLCFDNEDPIDARISEAKSERDRAFIEFLVLQGQSLLGL